jgi:hypothetical protein
MSCATKVSTYRDLLSLNQRINALRTGRSVEKNVPGPEWDSYLGVWTNGRSIQVTELPESPSGDNFWQVATFLPGLRFDMRFPILWCGTKVSALESAFAYARRSLPRSTIARWCGEDWLARDGDQTIVIMIVPASM